MQPKRAIEQLRQCWQQFMTKYLAQLEKQGGIVATWRQRGGLRVGPYYQLRCRDPAGSQKAVYLGSDPAVLAEVQQALNELRARQIAQRQLTQLDAWFREGLRQARRQLDQELKTRGLWRQGNEFRGWSQPGKQIE